MNNDNEKVKGETPVSSFFGDKWIWNSKMTKIWNARNLTLRLQTLDHWNSVVFLVGCFMTLSVSGKYSDEWRKWLCPNWGIIPAFFCRDWQKKRKNFNQDSQCPSWDSNQPSPEYKSTALSLDQPVQLKLRVKWGKTLEWRFCCPPHYCAFAHLLCTTSVNIVPYYFEHKTHILCIFSRWNIDKRLKSEECAPF
jgi:hypothetical protein